MCSRRRTWNGVIASGEWRSKRLKCLFRHRSFFHWYCTYHSTPPSTSRLRLPVGSCQYGVFIVLSLDVQLLLVRMARDPFSQLLGLAFALLSAHDQSRSPVPCCILVHFVEITNDGLARVWLSSDCARLSALSRKVFLFG